LVHCGLTRPEGSRWKLVMSIPVQGVGRIGESCGFVLVGHAIGTADTVN
jgi:hypothetical protein